MRIGGMTSAHEAGLRGYKTQMRLIPPPSGFGEREDTFIDLDRGGIRNCWRQWGSRSGWWGWWLLCDVPRLSKLLIEWGRLPASVVARRPRDRCRIVGV